MLNFQPVSDDTWAGKHILIVEDDTVLKFARVAHHHAIADDDILAHVTAAPDMTVIADPRRPFENRTLFDNRATADKNVAADKRTADELAEHRGFQTKL